MSYKAISKSTQKTLCSLIIFVLVCACNTSQSINDHQTNTTLESESTVRSTTHVPTVNTNILEINAGKEQAQEILDAIQRFNIDNNKFPLKLDELVPEYLNEIPITTTGQPYSYKQFDLHTFILTFRLSSSQDKLNAYCAYLYSSDLWECGIEYLP